MIQFVTRIEYDSTKTMTNKYDHGFVVVTFNSDHRAE